MAALDNNTPTPNTTDQVIITDKDTEDEYDKNEFGKLLCENCPAEKNN